MEETTMDLFKQTVQNDIAELKKSDKDLKDEIDKLKQTVAFHDRDITDIKDTLKEIKEDTKWLRRSITNALIVALITGAVAIFYAALKSQGGV
ncbi:hemolysin XhlA family protein [Mesobacillus subterraneus]|uniref:hemolysin XhlA family protein n=1 Tax=Mesobacillus subterraneus TaxID=285983 RepID=UPI001CFE36E5|nr:hemolysin XhlA family protein [Mesobacillus subterraneus]WLR54279.1 hemolysin XhlA family protein [Mesobacillus subterraneus]